MWRRICKLTMVGIAGVGMTSLKIKMFKKYLPILLALLGLSCIWPQAYADDDVYTVDFHFAYGDMRTALIEGRVLEENALKKASAKDSRLRNLKRNLKRFHNDEAKNMPLQLWFESSLSDAESKQQQRTVKTDSEGYFRLEMSVPEQYKAGWQQIYADMQGNLSRGKALIVPEKNIVGLISDLDDTILVSEVLSKRRLLSNTFLKNPMQRKTFPGAAELYRSVAQHNPIPDTAPIFYLSASPRQLHGAISEFLEHHQFPPGVVITKRVSDDLSSEPLFDQFAYKTKKIEEIFERLPHVRFILAGDDGEKDPEIYDHIRRNYPDRVMAVWIREVNTDPTRQRHEGQQDFPSLKEAEALLP